MSPIKYLSLYPNTISLAVDGNVLVVLFIQLLIVLVWLYLRFGVIGNVPPEGTNTKSVGDIINTSTSVAPKGIVDLLVISKVYL